MTTWLEDIESGGRMPSPLKRVGTNTWSTQLKREPCVYCVLFRFDTGNQRFVSRKIGIEHITPKSRGGTRVWHNIAPACQTCNNKRGNLPLLHWLVLLHAWTTLKLTKKQRKKLMLTHTIAMQQIQDMNGKINTVHENMSSLPV